MLFIHLTDVIGLLFDVLFVSQGKNSTLYSTYIDFTCYQHAFFKIKIFIVAAFRYI